MPSNGKAAEQDGGEQDALAHMLGQAGAAAQSGSQSTQEQHQAGRDVPTVVERDTALDPGNVPPPAYGEHYGEVHGEQEGFGTDAKVGDDGRVNIRIKSQNRKLSSLLTPVLRKQQEGIDQEPALTPPYIPPSLGGDEDEPAPPPMNVVIQVVGSRGDVQPFVALGKVLKDTYGHRVRLATHPVFKDFVRENDLEFFSIGGDPSQLMAFMVKNPGLMPSFDSLRAGDVGKRRKEVGEYLKGSWRSCYEAGDGLGPQATDQSVGDWGPQTGDADEVTNAPFVADCIIANPPSFAHIHIVEKMGIPLHIMFTMPYSATQAFPHPLANIQSSNADPHLSNYISYALIDMLTWQGLGDVINRFRQKSLGLEPINLVWAPGMLQRLKIPHTYCWSPALIPKPKDWAQHISISGFYFLNLASNYTPDPELAAFLEAGPPPVYIGFGSIVLDDPNAMTQLIFEAVRMTGQRALVSKGWGGMGADELGKPDNVYMLGNVPHDWLFKHVSAVVHHGGAGTTAAGITAGRPTLVVPFFGDQPFWGAMVARAGAGPDPIPHKQLTSEKLAEAIEYCLRPESQERAQELADKIKSENGSDVGAQSFHQFLDVDKLRCNLSPGRVGVWRLKRTQVRLSAMAACTLGNEGLLDFNDLKLLRSREYETDDGPWDPITGGATAIVGTMTNMMMGVADMPVDTLKALRIHPETAKQKRKPTADGDAQDAESTTENAQDDPSTAASAAASSSELPGASSGRSDTATSSGQSTPATSRTNSTFNVGESLAKLQNQPSPGSGRGGSMPTSMADALRGQLSPDSGGRSRSRSRPRSPGEGANVGARKSPSDLMETALDTGKGLRKIVGAGFSSPMDFTMGLTKGFHNAPKLYGDETVRKQAPVTDFRSGLSAATREFGYGMYDGITGLVTQPARGAAKEGAAGFIKGLGKGIGGIALKPGAAIFGIPGYTMKGVYKEMQKQFGSSVQNYIIAARTAQGFDEWQASGVEERQIIVARWKELQKNLKKKRNPEEMVKAILDEQRRKKQEVMSRMRQRARQCSPRSRNRAASTSQFDRSDGPEIHDAQSAALTDEARQGHMARSQTYAAPADLEEEDINEAIRLSVQETSRGNAREDAEVAKAIQASLAETERAHHGGHHDDEELERAIAESLSEARGFNDDAVVSSDAGPSGNATASDAGHVSGTTAQEFSDSQAQPDGGEKSQQERNEEQVVLEYMMKQSLLEEEHKNVKAS